MFDASSKERQAHHQFMTLSSEQQKLVDNHDLFGSAAAFHAVNAYSDHCEKYGAPKDSSEASKIINGFASSFITKESADKEMAAVDSQQALHYATQTLSDQMANKSSDEWVMKTAPSKTFDMWTQSVKTANPYLYDNDTYNFGNGGGNGGDTYNITVNNYPNGSGPRYQKLPPPEPCW